MRSAPVNSSPVNIFISSFCTKSFSKSILNVNTRAAHLSDLKGSKKYQISLCRQVPMNISEANVVYINSIINPKENTIRE